MKAFPNQIEMIDNVTYREVMKGGMELRDYFAAKAMQALLTSSNITKINGETVQNSDQYAEVAYLMADQMMEARNGTT